MSETKITDLVGRWKLVKHDFVKPDGTSFRPWGDTPIGMAEFDERGNFSAQILRGDRPAFASERPTEDEIRNAYLTYMAYFGTYTIVEEKKMLVNRVLGAINPNWVGGDQIRYYSYDGKQLTLRTQPFGQGDNSIVGTLVWERY